jgi:hypothetical protein
LTITADSARIFADAREMYAAALERLADDDIRDASEKAWCATRRATDALILARTGVEPEKSPDTTRGLDTLASQDTAVKPLVGRYFSRQGQLHGLCFYYGWCEPLSETERRIRETIDYIQDAERLADA